VFSPYYALARGLGRGDPHNHCAMNVALYGRSSKHWTLTERTRADLRRDTQAIQIGPSRLDWDGSTLTVFVDETTAPIPTRVVGTVRLRPQALIPRAFALEVSERHFWHPIAPCAEIEVAFEKPNLRWKGQAYLDSNFGDEPLEAAFKEWDWTRAHVGTSTAVIYDVTPRSSPPVSLALRFNPQGAVETFTAPKRAALPTTLWRVPRHARSENDALRLIKTLEDTPFYARSIVSAEILGEPTIGVHESLSLDRVANPIVRAMLSFRMPRRRWRRD
jgi:carotenoid 1,2-hydratase